ncbi:hypothetical protein [Rhizobium leguminosarum]|uniref:hypothetical protein n=1 Tax=Rhizobium leguminosarum TaxID=384 RepID=UPI0011D16CDD|nr:hypothetical protein [Rhizobium leguminosarum]
MLGWTLELLRTFGLESQIISGGTKKHDFHAKLFIGLGDKSELLSGSANIVGGPDGKVFVQSAEPRSGKNEVLRTSQDCHSCRSPASRVAPLS